MWHCKFVTKNSQLLRCAQLSFEYRSENRIVCQFKSNSHPICIRLKYERGFSLIYIFSNFVLLARYGKLWLKPLETFGTDTKLKVHRFTNNLQGSQNVIVKDFSWNIIPWNAFLFEKTLKQLSIFDIDRLMKKLSNKLACHAHVVNTFYCALTKGFKHTHVTRSPPIGEMPEVFMN